MPGSARRTTTTRRWGYGFAAVIDLVLLWAINIWPGWQEVPFLTEATTEVLPLVNASLVIGFMLHVAYILVDRTWFRALGHILTTVVSIAVLVRTLRVFPFDFGDSAETADVLTRVLLIFLIVASTLGLVSHVVGLVRGSRGPASDED